MQRYDYYLRSIALGMRFWGDQKLLEYGITNQQARLLGDIHQLIEHDQELSRKKLSETMGLRGPSVTSLLNGLEKNGFIVRSQDGADGRMMHIGLTDKARLLITEYFDLYARMQARLLENFTEEEKEQFLRLLMKASDNVARPD